MEKLRLLAKKLSGINLAWALVLTLLVKALIFDVSIATFLITIPILGFEGYKLFLKSKAPDPVRLDAELRKELDNMKSKLNLVSMEKNVSPAPTKRYF